MAPTTECFDDPAEFDERVRPFLDADPIRRTLPYTVLDAVLAGRYERWLLVAAEEAGAVVACAVQTPPHRLIVAADSRAGVDALVEAVAGAAPDVAGVVGVVGVRPWSTAFVEAWCARTGAVVELERASRLFRLDDLVAPRRAAGSARLAGADDVDLLVEWIAAFGREVGDPVLSLPRSSVVARVEAGQSWMWDDGEQPTSFLGVSRVLGGHARIGPVYTPPERRGRGFASCLVADVSADLLARGAVPTLFTDLANPTSNAIYQAIGYVPVADASETTFAPAG